MFNKSDRKLESTLRRLDQVLMQVEGFKPLLEYNANCAEFEIKANFAGLIDALNQRQLAVLKQLDKIHQEKISLIDSHKQTLDSLRSGILTCMTTSQVKDSCIHDLITRAESAVLSSSSAPFVSFRSERSFLPQAIATYGRIIAHYSGHFADPSQPSTCLPLAMEEEDDHEESHEHPAVFKQMTSGSCTCVKPDLRPWLFTNTHDCTCSRQLCHGIGKSAFFTVPSWCEKEQLPVDARGPTTKHAPATGNRFSNTQQSVRHWSYPVKPSDSMRSNGVLTTRKQSRTSSMDTSEFGGADSESITLLTGSGRSGSLKDWLFYDGMEFPDMPGLSTRRSSDISQDVATNPSTGVDFLNWLAPCPSSVAVVDNTAHSTASLTTLTSHSAIFPPDLVQTGPIDLRKWLSEVSATVSASMGAKPVVASPVEQQQQPEPETQTMIAAVTPVVESKMNEATPDCCIYSQCRGGPGGPTCCGARIPYAEPAQTTVQSYSTTTTSNSATTTNTEQDAPNFPPGQDSSTTTPCSVVEQLNRIADSHWSLWLAKDTRSVLSPSHAHGPSGTGQQFEQSSKLDGLNWLQSPLPAPTVSSHPELAESTVVDDSATPPKRRSIMTNAQTPLTTVDSTLDGCKSNCCSRGMTCHSRPADPVVSSVNTVVVQSTGDPEDRWLAQKMAYLTCAPMLPCKTQPAAADECWLRETGLPDSVTN